MTRHDLRAADLPLVLCIPEAEEDESLRRIAAAEQIGCYAGDTDNVLLRYSQAMTHLTVNAAVIVDADDLFVSVEAIRRIPEVYAGQDAIRFAGMVYGGAPYLLSRAIVDAMLAAGASPHGWSVLLERMPGDKLTVEDFAVTPDEQGYRLSLDYPEDLEYLGHLYRQLGPTAGHDRVVAYITANRAALASRFPALFDGSLVARAQCHLSQAQGA